MKMNQHELMIYTNDDYRENVLKCSAGWNSIKQFFTAQELLDEEETLTKSMEVNHNG